MKNAMTVGVLVVVLAAGGLLAAEPAKMKMTTEIPEGIATPDKVSTRVGTFALRDGIPGPGVHREDLRLPGLPQRRPGVPQRHPDRVDERHCAGGLLEFGPANYTALIFEELMDSKALFLTANTTSVYMMLWLQTQEGEPMVVETPPDVLGHHR